jgi:hypothetical protein
MIQSLGLFFFGTALQIVGLFTFGFTSWIAYCMRCFVFLAICGSGTNMTTIPSR